ncbi:leucine-rich repeat-containing protein [Corchorus olitorius]|uniref:Leucine-rich repeat-containing protein n=1 Tax=Corchorus olitorius TaxID=93759 RepID=A0A1R3HHE4_9ROSI|nr:leucine-rich repeat-containing protein [Corchorus olitorius]
MVKKDEIDFEVNKMENENKIERRRTLVKANTHLAGFEEGKLARIYQGSAYKTLCYAKSWIDERIIKKRMNLEVG